MERIIKGTATLKLNNLKSKRLLQFFQVISDPRFSFFKQLKIELCRCGNVLTFTPARPQGWGWWYSQFYFICRLGPVHPQKISTPKKIFEILAPHKNIPILYLDLQKRLKCIEVTPKYSPIL